MKRFINKILENNFFDSNKNSKTMKRRKLLRQTTKLSQSRTKYMILGLFGVLLISATAILVSQFGSTEETFASGNEQIGTCSVSSSEGYEVLISINPVQINKNPGNCPWGYNFSIDLEYDISFVGNNIPSSMWTLQGNLKSDDYNLFFPLNNNGGTGTTTTSTAWRSDSDCQTIDLETLNFHTIEITISGQGIPSQTIVCEGVPGGYSSEPPTENPQIETIGTCQVESDNNYIVDISITPISINPATSSCDWGYNFTVDLEYEIAFVGSDAPSSLWTLQGYLKNSEYSLFFDLPNNGGSGTTTTSNSWSSESNCNTVNLEDFNFDEIEIKVHGPGINNVTVNCISFITPEEPEISFNTSNDSGNMIHLTKNQHGVKIDHSPILDLDEAFTIETWFMLTHSSNQLIRNPLISKLNSNGGWEVLAGGSSRELGAAVYIPGNGCPDDLCLLTSDKNIVQNTWNHVALTYEYDAAINQSIVKLYQNGILSAQETYNGQIVISDEDFSIGKNFNYPNRTFSGYIDEVRYWKTSRSEEELRTFMCRILKDNDSNLVTYLNFDKNDGNTFQDLTDNGLITSFSNLENIIASTAPIGIASSFQYDSDSALVLGTDETYYAGVLNFLNTPSTVHIYRSQLDLSGVQLPSGIDGSLDYYSYGVFIYNENPNLKNKYDFFYKYNRANLNIDTAAFKTSLICSDINGEFNWLKVSASALQVNPTNPDLPSFSPGPGDLLGNARLFKTSGDSEYFYVEDEESSKFAMGYESSSSTLPVKLLSFNASYNGTSVDIKWQTSVEINNDYFTVEKSSDGINFEIFETVQGMGNSTRTVSYHTEDFNPSSGTNYYRLTQTDFDGTSETFPIVAVNLEKEINFQINLFPNPSNNQDVYLNIISNEIKTNQNLVANIFDLQGRLQSRVRINAADKRILLVPNGTLKSGIYIVSIKNEEIETAERLIIQ
ncbi:MAG: T9SS C-terminal target domain-containing protein [Chitinophagaceae bacterium]|nr:MAG: T9SS C-terminal target domain-containing protein [Chitinophagaceae bacterium]